MSVKTDILVIGAGISGLAASRRLKQLGKKHILVEKEKHAGGLSSSVRKGGFTFDYSGHLIHLRSEKTKKLVLSLLKGNILKLRRKAAIYKDGVFVNFPFQANLKDLPAKTRNECVREFIRRKAESILLPPPRPSSFREWSLLAFGKGISRHFMFPYNRKLWAYPLEKLGAEWCGDFVPRIKVEEIIKGAYAPNRRAMGYNSSFYYPERGGIGSLAEAFLKKAAKPFLDCEIVKINPSSKTAYAKNLGVIKYEKIISTIPLNSLCGKIKPVPPSLKRSAARLKSNRVYVLNLGVKKTAFPYHWVYFPERKFPFYRIGCYSNFSKETAPKGMSSFYIEISACGEIDIEEKEKKTLKALKTLGIIPRESDIAEKLWLKINPAYVIYDAERAGNLGTILPWLKTKDIHTTGRYGEWKYSFMEEDILSACEKAEAVS